MTAEVSAAPRAAVSVAELKRAWSAVQSGQFRATGHEVAEPTTVPRRPGPEVAVSQPAEWTPAAGELVVPVLGCGGSLGASTVALALAEAAAGRWPVRLIECGCATGTGLACASTAELGTDPATGWIRGDRDEVRIERGSDTLLSPDRTPIPALLPSRGQVPSRDLVSVLDVGWQTAQLLATPCWLRTHVLAAPLLVVVSVATLPGLRRLEDTLDRLARNNPARPERVVAAVVGPRRKKWPRQVEASAGARTHGLLADDRVVEVPQDPALSVAGISSAPLPGALLAAGAAIAQHITQPGTCTKGHHR